MKQRDEERRLQGASILDQHRLRVEQMAVPPKRPARNPGQPEYREEIHEYHRAYGEYVEQRAKEWRLQKLPWVARERHMQLDEEVYLQQREEERRQIELERGGAGQRCLDEMYRLRLPTQYHPDLAMVQEIKKSATNGQDCDTVDGWTRLSVEQAIWMQENIRMMCVYVDVASWDIIAPNAPQRPPDYGVRAKRAATI